MKQGIHPDYQPVIFVDANTGREFISRTTKKSSEKRVVEGVEHRVISLEITSDTHPFWTGKMHRVDTAGRIDKFNKRFGQAFVGAKRKTRKVTKENGSED